MEKRYIVRVTAEGHDEAFNFAQCDTIQQAYDVALTQLFNHAIHDVVICDRRAGLQLAMEPCDIERMIELVHTTEG